MPEEQRRIDTLSTHVDAARRQEDKVRRLREAEAAATAASAGAAAAARQSPPPPSPRAQARADSPTLRADDYERQQRAAGRQQAAAAPEKPQLDKPAASSAATAAPAGASASGGAQRPRRAYKVLSVHPLLHPSMRREFWASEQFDVTKRLHKGYASEVYKAKDKQSGEACAVKVYDVTQVR
jgi:hypothetical protein